MQGCMYHYMSLMQRRDHLGLCTIISHQYYFIESSVRTLTEDKVIDLNSSLLGCVLIYKKKNKKGRYVCIYSITTQSRHATYLQLFPMTRCCSILNCFVYGFYCANYMQVLWCSQHNTSFHCYLSSLFVIQQSC